VPAPRLQRAHQGIAASKRAARAPAATHQPAPAAAVDPDAELALLTRAERALATRPAVALVILQEHEQRFAQGVLAQERETMRIDAELALGQRAQAVARARAFIARFPGSPHRHRFEPLLASPPPPPSDHKHRAPHIPTD
jgi:hypothetical protein